MFFSFCIFVIVFVKSEKEWGERKQVFVFLLPLFSSFCVCLCVCVECDLRFLQCIIANDGGCGGKEKGREKKKEFALHKTLHPPQSLTHIAKLRTLHLQNDPAFYPFHTPTATAHTTTNKKRHLLPFLACCF